VLAGDLSGDIKTFQNTLEICASKFDKVFFVVGNHDLWVQNVPGNSLNKLLSIVDVCDKLGVQISPVIYRNAAGVQQNIAIFPLLSWYHSSWDTEPDLPDTERNSHLFDKRWADFRNCEWPEEICTKVEFASTVTQSTALADYFASLNQNWILNFKALASLQEDSSEKVVPYSSKLTNKEDRTLLTFSHYLPCIQLCPEKRFLREPNIMKVSGSSSLQKQVQELEPDLHIFGHTHIPIDLMLNGVRYVNWPLGSIREHEKQCSPVKATGPLLVYDTSEVGILPVKETWWGGYYTRKERDVRETARDRTWVKLSSQQ